MTIDTGVEILTDICRTGFGQHGDYVFGWKEDALQRAMDNRCTGDSCPDVLKTQSGDVAKTCTLPQTLQEDIEGCKCTLYTTVTFEALLMVLSNRDSIAAGWCSHRGVGRIHVVIGTWKCIDVRFATGEMTTIDDHELDVPYLWAAYVCL